MKFEEPKVEFIEIDSEVVTANSGSQCVDNWTGGVMQCDGANMEGVCGTPMAVTQ